MSVPLPLSRRRLLVAGGAGLVLAGLTDPFRAAPARAAVTTADLVVYGATSGGLAAAITMRRLGRTAVVVEPTGHVGGLSTAGLGATDTGVQASIGGLAAEFYRRVYVKYHGGTLTPTSPLRMTFEPHVATAVFAEMLAEAGVPVVVDARLSGLGRTGNRITELRTEDGSIYRGGVFVDATYEGDLLAMAGVGFTVGRESNDTYGETINGVQSRNTHQFAYPVDPYVTAGSPASGLLPGISATPLPPQGSGDDKIQAYCFRMCLTQAANRIPFGKPSGYDPIRYELLLRHIQAGYTGPYFTTHSVGGGKTDSNNNGAVSTDNIGFNYAYPTASWATRESIIAEHRTYQQGLMWFLANDPRLPASVRDSTARWGLPVDEFTGTGGWPPMLYIREARRMISAYVMTEADCRGRVRATDSVGLASYTMDSHNCQRVVVDGRVRNEGDVQIGVPAPYPVSYRAIVPHQAQCANLLVPVCLSSSHIAYGSIRMEPVFMILGQAAATAASLALAGNLAVQAVSVPALQTRLRQDGAVLEWGSTSEVILDNAASSGITRAGTWLRSTSIGGYYGPDYEHDGNTAKGVNRLRFRPSLPASGSWTVQLRWTADPNRATNVPVDIAYSGGLVTRTVNQRQSGGQWVPLGTYQFTAGSDGSVLIRTEDTDGHVVADAVRFVRV
ncbi:FAD-dependent oxidoreductase [Micromonospora noduli]|uniref:Cellulase n=1 Tax=Micromonospora noduli TaxID=709876 RepID=A0A328NI25_9ACTN|nr:FAD-dependent oxidoreductase [Micromonospora noduli]RAO06951.1 Cellulase [Micromonospora noduli]